MHTPAPITKDLVLIGGGHTHALVLKNLAAAPLPGVRVTLINPDVTAPYTGMLPGYVAGHYARADLDIDLVKLARRAAARLVLDKAVSIDTGAKRVALSGRPEIAYDTLSVNIGITSNLPKIKGFAEHGYAAKPLGPFSAAWDKFVDAVAAGEKPAQVCVLGAGVAGVELALAMAHRLGVISDTPPEITLLEAGNTSLAGVGRNARNALLAELTKYNVKLVLDAQAIDVLGDHVVLASGRASIASAFTVSAAGARPHAWLAQTGLALEGGYLSVDENLAVQGVPNIFAAGDCAHLSHAPRPKAGVFAVREAPVLLNNLRADLGVGELRPYHPQKSYLKLISLGRKSAIFDKFGLSLKGERIWRLKDRIDRDFMDQFAERAQLPNMDDMLCGGCGAKVSHSALAGLSDAHGFEDAAISKAADGYRVLTTDHLRALTDDPWLMGKIAATHAMGDIWAMGAKPTTVLANVILPHMAPPQQANTLRELMTGACTVFDQSEATVRGGHTSMGHEMTVGFTIEGARSAAPITLSGALPGDVLVLTKPIGNGVILAAEMRRRAEGNIWQSAITSMCRPMDEAADILAGSATAMTDVTGFGLAGHLLNILTASGMGAELDLESVPLLEGALALCEAGIKSSIWESNAEIRTQMSLSGSPRSDLLFDPQTCGGLLACIPSAKLTDTITAMEAAREPVWVIGKIMAGAPFITVT